MATLTTNMFEVTTNVHNMWQNAKIGVNAMKMHRLCFGLCQKQLFDLFLNINSNI